MVMKIALLTPLVLGENSGLLIDLARGAVRKSNGSCRIDVISYAAARSHETLEDGLVLRFLPQVQQPLLAQDALSWDLPSVIAGTDVVHIHQIYSRSGEMALLLAKLLRKPICVSQLGAPCSTLGADLEILRLADRVIDLAQLGVYEEASDFLAAGARLLTVYQGLLAEARSAAA